jgi:hypothetical protein
VTATRNDPVGPPTADIQRGYGPRWLPTALIVLATLLAVVGTLTTWLRVQMLDTEQWVSVSNGLLEEPEVRSALSTYLGEQLFEAVDVRAELENLLPPRLEGLAGPLTGLVRVSVANAVEQLIASDRFADLWEGANRRTHTVAVAVLRGEDVGRLSTTDGAITLELGEALERIGERLGLPDEALSRIPPEFGRITVADSDDLAAAQRAVRVADLLSWAVLLVVIALYAAAVALAAGRRMNVVSKIGIALVIGSAFLLVTRLLGVRVAISSIVRRTENESVATAVGMVATELLRNIAWTGIAAGLVIAGAAAVSRSWRRGVPCDADVGA